MNAFFRTGAAFVYQMNTEHGKCTKKDEIYFWGTEGAEKSRQPSFQQAYTDVDMETNKDLPPRSPRIFWFKRKIRRTNSTAAASATEIAATTTTPAAQILAWHESYQAGKTNKWTAHCISKTEDATQQERVQTHISLGATDRGHIVAA